MLDKIWQKLRSHSAISSGALLLLAFVLGSVLLWHFRSVNTENNSPVEIAPVPEVTNEELNLPENAEYAYHPGPISFSAMKTKGCVADGLLSGYGEDTEEAVAMIKRSDCSYLHRALETWAAPPDFGKANEIMSQIDKSGIIYGMFIAEAIRTNADDYYEEDGYKFDFSKMCRQSSDNAWGEHTCKPDLGSGEYIKYLKYITHKAIDLGIQSFLFGQIYYQERTNLKESRLPDLLTDMRRYAKRKGVQIAIGAQTGDITDEAYLRQFDYIEGGVGIGDDGQIEDGPCWSRMESCWALLWNDRYAKKANNVLLNLDWSGLKFDDMSVYARMMSVKRAETLKYLYNYFTSRDIGFLMPMMATINKTNDGCYGPKKRFYSASNQYTCRDENVINSILRAKNF